VTINPGVPPAVGGFALLASGANFSCEVLLALISRDYLPGIIALPEYPPAAEDALTGSIQIEDRPERPLLQLGQGIETAYVPAAAQADFTSKIEQRGIEFLLVACWPYLIESRLIESAGKAALNLHPSLLPRYRGPDPLTQQLALADPDFGVSLHLLSQRFDRGDIIAQDRLPNSTAQPQRSMLERLCAQRGVELFIEAVESYPDWRPVAQSD
jgi:methionyl-tRNA formyltransferase